MMDRSTNMNAKSKLIGQFAAVLTAVAILIGVSGGLAKAEPIDINSGPMTVARALCVGSGGDWELTNGIFRCYYGDHFTGHGWACDMTVSPPVCWSFFRLPQGKITIDVGAATMGNAQMAPSNGDSTGLPVDVSAVQAQIASAQVAAAATATPQATPTKGRVSKVNTANVSIVSAP
jgi:hypothetical protein